MNLRETYVLDLKFGCDIQTMLQMIDAKLLEFSHLNFPPPPLTLSTSCSVSSDFLFRFSIRAARSRVSFLAALAFWNPAAAPTPGSTFFPP